MLMVDARGVDGRIEGHAVVDDVGHDLENRRDDVATPARARHEHRLPVVSLHDRRGHGREHPLARSDRVGIAHHQPFTVGRARLGGEVIHLVVQQKAITADGRRRPEAGIDRRGQCDGVPLAIDDREMRRVLAFRAHTSRERHRQ